MLHPARGVRGEFQASGRTIAVHQLVQAWLVDRHLAAIEALYAGGIGIHAYDVVTGLGQAGAGNQAHIARAKNSDFHW